MARDKTRKDHNGNFLGFDPTRKVWVTIPRDVGKNMISRGELANGALMVTTRYPEFSPSAAPKAPQATPAGQSKIGAWADKKDAEWRQTAKAGWDQGIRNIKGMVGIKGY